MSGASPDPVAAPAGSGNGQVRVRALRKVFDDRVVLDRLDLDIGAGEFVALLGRSGSGKSTLLRILAGLHEPDGASVLAVGEVAVAFQEPRLLPWLRVWRNVALAFEGAGGPRSRGDGRTAAAALLGEVGLQDRADAWPLTLSGGEAQRVSLARALAREPEVLLLDEPFGALDALTRIAMRQLVQQLRRIHQPAVLLVTHDVDEAILLADRVLVLVDGRIRAEHRVPPVPSGTDPADATGSLRRQLLDALGVAGTGNPRDTWPEPPTERSARLR